MDKNQEPIVLGTVKKGRTGKPILAVIIIILIGSLIYFLPTIQSYFKDKSLIDLIVSGELISYFKNNSNNNVNNTPIDEFVTVGDNVFIENANLIISNIQLKDNVLSYKIKSKTATFDATKEDLYLQIYVNKETLVYTKSLDEIFTIEEKEILENVSFYNSSSEYYARIKNITSNDIEDIILSSDESGLASITCFLNNDTYEYVFQNKELIELNRTYQYKYDASKESEYQNAYKVYNDLKNARGKYNIVASLNEDYIGFNYKENIDLSKIDVTELGVNYYPYKTEAKVVKFKQEAKGFDCE